MDQHHLWFGLKPHFQRLSWVSWQVKVLVGDWEMYCTLKLTNSTCKMCSITFPKGDNSIPPMSLECPHMTFTHSAAFKFVLSAHFHPSSKLSSIDANVGVPLVSVPIQTLGIWLVLVTEAAAICAPKVNPLSNTLLAFLFSPHLYAQQISTGFAERLCTRRRAWPDALVGSNKE